MVTLLSLRSITSSNVESVLCVTLICLVYRCFKPVSQREMEVWEFAELLRWHFPPSWHRPQALAIYSHSFLPKLAFQPINDCVNNIFSAWSSLHSMPASSDPAATKKSCWDAPSIAAAKSTQHNSYPDNHKRLYGLAAVCAPHSSDWLHALLISSCGLDNEAIRISVALRLGINLCVPHTCP